MKRLAVVIFNLGGPDKPEAVEPFLFNLFNDPAIIGLPGIFRFPLAKLISRRRAPIAKDIYAHIGGKSPLLEETEAQARALEKKISSLFPELADEVRVFVAMRYWHPMSEATAREVQAFDPDRIILLPLYPHFSSTTTGSSLKEWTRAARAAGLDKPARAVCCYPLEAGYVRGMTEIIRPAIAEAENRMGKGKRVRVLFSAHGLPEKVIARGDPYQWQIEQTAAAVAESLETSGAGQELDWAVCYQSRVGPLKWIGPSLEEELKRAAQDGAGVVVVPVAFVSEHSETLVELDIEYRHVAEDLGLAAYVRVPTLSVQDDFIGGLARTVEAQIVAADTVAGDGTGCQSGQRLCPARLKGCPLAPV